MATKNEFAGLATETQKQTLAVMKSTIEAGFDLGVELLELQKEYALRVADAFGARAPKVS